MSTTRVTRHLDAPRSRVYAALTDPADIVRWKVPRTMTCELHEFDGESFRISLTYDAPDRVGKSSAHTDTYRGRFIELVPDERVVEVDEFETDDPAFAGPMTITITLADDGSGTKLSAVHEGVPAAVAPADNEAGWNESLDRLAQLLVPGQDPPGQLTPRKGRPHALRLGSEPPGDTDPRHKPPPRPEQPGRLGTTPPQDFRG